MCINVLLPRLRPFKFGWVSISLCYAKISIFCPASSAHFPSSNVISSWSISSVCVYVLWVYNGAPQPCFFTLYSRLHTDDRPDDDHFCFPFYMGVMYQEAEFATNIQQEGPQWFQWKSTQTSKQEFPKDFSQLFVMKFVYYLHLTSYLISQ